MNKAIIAIGSGALNIIEENELYEDLERPIYVLLSHKSDALEEKAQKVMRYGGQVLFIVDLEQPFRKLNKRQKEQLVGLYEQELKEIVAQHDTFLVIGGAAGYFSGTVLQFLIKLLSQKRKTFQVVTWLATPFEGKRFDSQIEELLQLINRLRVDATIIEPNIIEEQMIPYLAAWNEEIARRIMERCW